MKWGVTVHSLKQESNLINLGLKKPLLLLYKEFTVNVRKWDGGGARAEAGRPIKKEAVEIIQPRDGGGQGQGVQCKVVTNWLDAL